MAKMTRKGQKFVGREISKLMRKGPSSGPQKGRRMFQKQAVAASLNVARKKGYKVPPPPKKEAVLYRDPEYGGLAVIAEDDGSLVTYDHNSMDAAAVLAVLERSAQAERRDDGGVAWRPRRGVHRAIIEANLQRVVQVLGYTDDPLAERAAVAVSRSEAVSPDLPDGDRFHMIHEPLEAGLRRHVEVAIAALQEHGRVTPPTIKFHGRPHARDTFGRPLPFLIARSFVESEDLRHVERDLREALRPVAPYVVRATVMDEGGLGTIEVALAPTAAVCESYMDATIPTFESQTLSGARTVWFSLGTALEEDEAADIAALATMSTSVVGLRTERAGRAVVAHVPSSHHGTHVADRAFQERLQWLVGLLDPWDPEVRDIGEQEAIQAGAPSRRDGLTEADADLRRLEREAMLDPGKAVAYQAALARAGRGPRPVDPDLEPSDPPSALDAHAVRELDVYLKTSDAQSYRDMVRLNKQYAKRRKAGTYRRDLAAKGYLNYVVTPTAKRYVREFGGDLRITFPVKVREFVAMELAKRFERLWQAGLPGDLGLSDQYESVVEAETDKSLDEGVRDILMADLRRLNPQRGADTGLPGVIWLKQPPHVVASALADAGWHNAGPGVTGGSTAFIKVVGGEKAVTNLYSRFGGTELSRGVLDLRVFPGAGANVGQRVRDELQDLAFRIGKPIRWERRDEARTETDRGSFAPTPGLVRAAFKVPGSARQCEECGLGVPRYPGRYPAKCPRCGAAVVVAEGNGVVMKGTGKTTKQENPKGAVVQVGEPEPPEEDEDLTKLIQGKLKAAKERYKEASRA